MPNVLQVFTDLGNFKNKIDTVDPRSTRYLDPTQFLTFFEVLAGRVRRKIPTPRPRKRAPRPATPSICSIPPPIGLHRGEVVFLSFSFSSPRGSHCQNGITMLAKCLQQRIVNLPFLWLWRPGQNCHQHCHYFGR